MQDNYFKPENEQKFPYQPYADKILIRKNLLLDTNSNAGNMLHLNGQNGFLYHLVASKGTNTTRYTSDTSTDEAFVQFIGDYSQSQGLYGLQAGQTYTLNAKFNFSGSNNIAKARILLSTTGTGWDIDNWYDILSNAVTFTIPANAKEIIIRFNLFSASGGNPAVGDWMEPYHEKLEIGATATPWSPAPEDIGIANWQDTIVHDNYPKSTYMISGNSTQTTDIISIKNSAGTVLASQTPIASDYAFSLEIPAIAGDYTLNIGTNSYPFTLQTHSYIIDVWNKSNISDLQSGDMLFLKDGASANSDAFDYATTGRYSYLFANNSLDKLQSFAHGFNAYILANYPDFYSKNGVGTDADRFNLLSFGSVEQLDAIDRDLSTSDGAYARVSKNKDNDVELIYHYVIDVKNATDLYSYLHNNGADLTRSTSDQRIQDINTATAIRFVKRQITAYLEIKKAQLWNMINETPLDFSFSDTSYQDMTYGILFFAISQAMLSSTVTDTNPIIYFSPFEVEKITPNTFGSEQALDITLLIPEGIMKSDFAYTTNVNTQGTSYSALVNSPGHVFEIEALYSSATPDQYIISGALSNNQLVPSPMDGKKITWITNTEAQVINSDGKVSNAYLPGVIAYDDILKKFAYSFKIMTFNRIKYRFPSIKAFIEAYSTPMLSIDFNGLNYLTTGQLNVPDVFSQLSGAVYEAKSGNKDPYNNATIPVNKDNARTPIYISTLVKPLAEIQVGYNRGGFNQRSASYDVQQKLPIGTISNQVLLSPNDNVDSIIETQKGMLVASQNTSLFVSDTQTVNDLYYVYYDANGSNLNFLTCHVVIKRDGYLAVFKPVPNYYIAGTDVATLDEGWESWSGASIHQYYSSISYISGADTDLNPSLQSGEYIGSYRKILANNLHLTNIAVKAGDILTFTRTITSTANASQWAFIALADASKIDTSIINDIVSFNEQFRDSTYGLVPLFSGDNGTRSPAGWVTKSGQTLNGWTSNTPWESTQIGSIPIVQDVPMLFNGWDGTVTAKNPYGYRQVAVDDSNVGLTAGSYNVGVIAREIQHI